MAFAKTSHNPWQDARYTITGDVFLADLPRVWVATLPSRENFDVSPDGKRLLVLAPVETRTPPQAEHEIVFVENFLDELLRRVSHLGR
jgi:hypothetical protein